MDRTWTVVGVGGSPRVPSFGIPGEEDNQFGRYGRTILWIFDHILHRARLSLISPSPGYGGRNRKQRILNTIQNSEELRGAASERLEKSRVRLRKVKRFVQVIRFDTTRWKILRYAYLRYM